MAARKKSTNKSNHGTRTHEALLSLTPSSNMNAAIITPKFTPLPTSKFSSRFQTKGTRTPIKRDFLISPKSTQPKYKHEDLQTLPRETDYRSYDLRTRRFGDRAEEAAFNLALNAANAANTAITSENTSKTSALNTATSSFNKAIGARTVALSRGSGSGRSTRGSVGANGVL